MYYIFDEKLREQIEQAIRAGEREEQAWSMFPDTSMAGDSVLGPFYPVGPASPFNYGYYYGYQNQ